MTGELKIRDRKVVTTKLNKGVNIMICSQEIPGLEKRLFRLRRSQPKSDILHGGSNRKKDRRDFRKSLRVRVTYVHSNSKSSPNVNFPSNAKSLVF